MSKSFLGAFAKLRKTTVSFVTSVHLSAWNITAPIGRTFAKFDVWLFVENLSRKFRFDENLTRITGTLLEGKGKSVQLQARGAQRVPGS